MNRIAEFKKVSVEEFAKDCEKNGLELDYEDIKLPLRATSGSAGYDFYAPCDIILNPGEQMVIPTGIRAKIDDGWFLMLCPRSGLGYKFKMQLNNTVGIIDSDYYYADNEGHIMAKIFNDSREEKTLEVKKGAAFIQGIFIPFGITVDDSATDKRTGGFGSTTK